MRPNRDGMIKRAGVWIDEQEFIDLIEKSVPNPNVPRGISAPPDPPARVVGRLQVKPITITDDTQFQDRDFIIPLESLESIENDGPLCDPDQ